MVKPGKKNFVTETAGFRLLNYKCQEEAKSMRRHAREVCPGRTNRGVPDLRRQSELRSTEAKCFGVHMVADAVDRTALLTAATRGVATALRDTGYAAAATYHGNGQMARLGGEGTLAGGAVWTGE